MYDLFKVGNNGEKNKNNKTTNDQNPILQKLKQPEYKIIYENYVKIQNSKPEQKNEGELEVGYIKPETRFGKVGMVFAKIGVGIAGVTGIFNGIVMKVPLMSVGEATNVCASPVINTAMGSGLLDIGLAAIFAGRALENDPALKLNSVVLKSKQGIGAKAKYIGQNMSNCAKEVWNSTKTVFGSLFNLAVRSKRKEAARFFRDQIFAIRPTVIQFSEKILADGSKIKEMGLKSSPYRMHAASFILGIGGITKVISSIVKNRTGQKAGFEVSKVGGGLDNISLSMYGLEKVLMGSPAAGIPLALSGATILASQPRVDKKDGRSVQWLGCGALFLTFIVERGRDFKIARKLGAKIKNGELIDQSAQIIRTFEIPLTHVKGMSRKFLNKHLGNLEKAIKPDIEHGDNVAGWLNKQIKEVQKNLSKKKISAKKANKAIKEASDKAMARQAMENDPNVAPIIKMTDTVKKILSEGLYNPDTKAVQTQINNALKKQGGKTADFIGHIIPSGLPGKPEEILRSIHHDNITQFGKEKYSTEILNKILAKPERYNGSKIKNIILEEAEKAKK